MTQKDILFKGGDLILKPGVGFGGGPSGAIRFVQDDEDVMRFEPTGEVFVRGEMVDDNSLVYDVFKRWLRNAGVSSASR